MKGLSIFIVRFPMDDWSIFLNLSIFIVRFLRSALQETMVIFMCRIVGDLDKITRVMQYEHGGYAAGTSYI